MGQTTHQNLVCKEKSNRELRELRERLAGWVGLDIGWYWIIKKTARYRIAFKQPTKEQITTERTEITE